MRRLALLAFVTCACGVPRTAPVTPSAAPSAHPEATVTYDADATGAVKGLVRHHSTDAPLGNAIVVLHSKAIPDLEMTTDDYGRYSFEGLPAGSEEAVAQDDGRLPGLGPGHVTGEAVAPKEATRVGGTVADGAAYELVLPGLLSLCQLDSKSTKSEQ